MLVNPDVGEDESTQVCKSRDNRLVLKRVVSPDEGNKGLHEVHVLVVLRGETSDWKVEVYLYPFFYRCPQYVLV